MNPLEPFFIRQDNIYALPAFHYNMECACQVRLAFEYLQPDCVAVELAETMQLQLLHAASRLPDLSVVMAYTEQQTPLYYLCEPCDAAFEGLRSALERQIPAYCIDLDVDGYPAIRESFPDPYSIQRIGLKTYYEAFDQAQHVSKEPLDFDREMHMAKRLKELSLRHERILFVGGMSHIRNILALTKRSRFPELIHAGREVIELCTLTEDSTREVMAECGWFTVAYEQARGEKVFIPPDRQRLIFSLFKNAAEKYIASTGNSFPGYHLRNLMKFARNYALVGQRLMPDLFQILSVARCCVDHNFAYETWLLATEYPFLSNIDNLLPLDLSLEDLWKHTKQIRFHLKQPSRKNLNFEVRQKDKGKVRFQPPNIFSICSYPPEDKAVENFGDFLKKKGTQILTEEAGRTIPFSSSLEDGIDIKETLHHWFERKLYVRVKGKPLGGVGSVVVIFDEDTPKQENEPYQEKYPWAMTWMGEHEQESDMALYSTSPLQNVIGPGISRCEYGGFLMSYPPRRMHNVWGDPDYSGCRTKAEVLLMAGIDYAQQPVIVYVAAKPPRSIFKSFAQRYGKKVVYLPLGQLSPVTLNKMRSFHVLDGYDKRSIAGEYIF